MRSALLLFVRFVCLLLAKLFPFVPRLRFGSCVNSGADMLREFRFGIGVLDLPGASFFFFPVGNRASAGHAEACYP